LDRSVRGGSSGSGFVSHVEPPGALRRDLPPDACPSPPPANVAERSGPRRRAPGLRPEEGQDRDPALVGGRVLSLAFPGLLRSDPHGHLAVSLGPRGSDRSASILGLYRGLPAFLNRDAAREARPLARR